MEIINGYEIHTNCLDAPVRIEEIRDTDDELVLLFGDRPFTFAIGISKTSKKIYIDILDGA